jgi:hypothetical protein
MFTEPPLEFIHATPDGLVSLLTYRDKVGGWKAVLSGSKIAASHFKSISEANRFLLKAFERLAPGHTCSDQCGTMTEVSFRRFGR